MPVGANDDRSAIPDLLLEQASWCRKLGSPLYGELLERAAVDFRAGGPCAAVLAGHDADPRGSMLPLRFMGAVHRLVLDGRTPDLARHYPSAGGTPGSEVWRSFRDTVAAHLDELRRLVLRPVQTNEVARCGALLGGFLTVAAETGLPLRLLEVGASAGLNLRWDHYRYATPEGSFGPPDSPVRLEGFLTAGRLPLDVAPRIAERRGGDQSPIDATTDDGRRTLRAYVWADQRQRHDLLEGALEVARRVPVAIDRADAADWLETMLAAPTPGLATLVYHSIVWQYLGRAGRERAEGALAAAGSRATREAPIAWLRLEPGGEQAEVRLTLWPGGVDRVLAESGFHGRDVRWRGPGSSP